MDSLCPGKGHKKCYGIMCGVEDLFLDIRSRQPRDLLRHQSRIHKSVTLSAVEVPNHQIIESPIKNPQSNQRSPSLLGQYSNPQKDTSQEVSSLQISWRPYREFFIENIREFVAKPPLSKRKKMQTYKPGSVSNLTLKPYHLSKRSVAETLYLPTLLHRAGTLKHRFT